MSKTNDSLYTCRYCGSTYDNLNACVICENNCMKAENRKKEEEKKLEKEQQQKMELENLDIEIDAIKKDCVKITEAKHSAIKAFNEQYNKIINKYDSEYAEKQKTLQELKDKRRKLSLKMDFTSTNNSIDLIDLLNIFGI